MKTAVVTGGASGIGRAIARALTTRGVHVTIADIAGAQAAAKEIDCAWATVDVTDAEAVYSLTRTVRDEHGRLDWMFNNAGIAVAGRAQDLDLDHWNRSIDVNLRGVVHGVHAAYPIMIAQGFGHIVNTASVAGLTPAPLMIPYTTTKYAVVGLSLSLRAEAAAKGVKVSVICPGFVDTPLLDNANPGLPPTPVSRDTRALATKLMGGSLYSADALAEDVLRGVARNKALIVAPVSARSVWRLMRAAPELGTKIFSRGVR